ncbi:MAG: ABC transporter ATP-binding protein, partial [Anaerolineae bacterium]
MNTRDTLSQYARLLSTYLRPLKRQVILLSIFLFSGIGLQLWKPQILRDFIDVAQAGGVSHVLMRKAALFFALVIAGQVLQLATTYLTQDVRWRATNRMRGDLAAHCLWLDMPFHNAHTPGSIIERIDGDVNVLSSFFSRLMIEILGNSLLLIGILVLLFREDWRIGIAFLAFVGVVAFVLARSVKITAPLWKDQREASSQLFGYLEERLGGTEDIRANGAVRYVLRGLQKAIRNLAGASQKAFVASVALNWGFTEGMLALGTVMALGLGGLLLRQGALTIGSVYLIFHYNTMLQWPLNQLARQLRDLQSATGSIERIQELFDMSAAVRDPPPDQAEVPTGGALSVTFSEVDFRYPDDGAEGGWVLNSVDWHLNPGEVVGVLGRTGSGKTTMTRLLCRLYDPVRGEVRLNGVPLVRVPMADLRRRVGIVTQDVQLFQATVRDNLTLFDEAVDDERLLRVVDGLGLGPWLDDLPGGLDTELGTNVAGLSAG